MFRRGLRDFDPGMLSAGPLHSVSRNFHVYYESDLLSAIPLILPQ